MGGVAQKERQLRGLLADMGSVIVAFSGGVDSAYLAYLAARILGSRALSVTGVSPSYPAHHRQLAVTVATEFHLAHEFIPTEEMEQPEYLANNPDRCFHCKSELFTKLAALARDRGFRYVVDGNNADDRGDYRPGREAAKALGVRSPLDEVGLSKREIRELSRQAGLPTWAEPASACLSSRVPYYTPISAEKLDAIERGEIALRDLGFRVLRVRHHGEIARLEFGRDELARAVEPEIAAAIIKIFQSLGFRYVTLDLQGYRTGSLNEALTLSVVNSR